MKAVFFDVEAIVLQPDPSGPSYLNKDVRSELERLVLEDIALFAVTEATTDCWNSRVGEIPDFSMFFRTVLALGQSTDANQIQELYCEFLDANDLKASDCLYFYNQDSQLDKANITTAIGMESEILTKWLYVRLVLHGVYWPDARSATHKMTRQDITLAGDLAKHVAVKMCSLYDQLNWDAEPLAFRDEISTAKEWEQCFDRRDPFSHGHISAFERAAYSLQKSGLARAVENDDFELLVRPADIPEQFASRSDLTKENFALIVEAFFNIACQCGWNENYFEADLIGKFIATGLVCHDGGHLAFTSAMAPYFTIDGQLPSVFDAETFFRSTCS